MATQRTDFSLSVNVNPDISQVQKTLDRRAFRVNAQVDIDTRMVQQRINNLFQNQNLDNLGFERINTKIQRNLTGLDQYGRRVTGLIKYTETFKNAIGDVNERVTLLTRNGQVLGQSLENIQRGVHSITSETRQFNSIIDGVNTSVTEVTRTTRDTGGNIRTVIERTSEWVDENNRLNRTVETLDENNNQLAPIIRTVSDNIRDAGNNAQDTERDIRNLGNATEETANEMRTLGDAIVGSISQIVQNYIAQLPMRLLSLAISETTDTLKEFDNAIIEFRKVSDLAGDSLTRYVAKLAEMGEVTGSTMTAMVEAATEFKKSGFSEQDSAKLASVAEMYRNIADEEISAADSASFIIAQMKAFNIEAENSTHIIDAVNEVSNNFAVSSADLANNLGKMSATMAVSGASFEEQLGLLTGVTEITRSASSASRGLIMITSRLTQVLDESSSTGKKLTAIYDKLGISLKDQDGQLRNVYDILYDLSLQWNNLSENEQKYIALTSSGARQQQNFVALMKNFDNVINATAKAYNSAGSAAKENDKAMDSVAKKTQILKSEFQKFVLGDGGLQDASKVILDLGIALLKLANTPVGKVVIEISLLTAGIVALTSAVHALTVAMATNPLLLLATAISAVVVIALECANAEDEATRAHRENTEAVKEATEAYNSYVSEIKRLKDAIQDIEDKKVNITDENELKTLAKEEESLRRQVELLETKAEIERKKAEKGAKEELSTTVLTVDEKGEGHDVRRDESIKIQIDMLKKLEAEYDELDKKERQQSSDLSKMSADGTQAYIDLENELRNTTKEKQDLGDQIDETKEGLRDFIEETNNLTDALTSTDEETVNFKEVFINAVEDGLKYLNETLFETEDGLEEVKDGEEDLEDTTDEVQDAIQNLAQSLGLTQLELDKLNEMFDETSLLNFLTELQEAKQTIDDTNTIIDNLQESLETASEALEEYNANGYLTIDTFQSLMSISAQYLAALVNENGQLEINQQTLSNLVDELKIAKIEELAEAAAMEIAALQHQESATTANAAQRAVDEAGEAFKRAGDKASKASTGIALFNAELSKATGGSLGDLSGSEKVIVEKYRKLAREISNLTVNTTAAGNAASSAGKKGAGAAKDATDATKELNKELEETKKKYEQVIKWISKQYDKEINNIKKTEKEALKAEEAKIKAKEKEKDKALDAIEKEIDALEKAKDARKKYWDDQIDALKKANDARKDALELQEKLDALEKARNTKVKIYKEGQGFVYDVDQTEVAKAQKALDEYLSEKAYEDELARLEALRDAEMDNYEKRLDALNEYKDKVQKAYEEELEALKEHKEKLQEQYEAEIEIYENYKQQFEDMVNAYEEEQNRLLAQQLTHIDFENKNWMTRLDNLAAFVNEYNKLQKQLDTGNTSVSNNVNLKSGGTAPSNTGGNKNNNNNIPSTTSTNRAGVKTVTTGNYAGTSSVGQSGAVTKKIAFVGDSKVGKSGVVTLHANGTPSVKQDEIAVVGENPNKEIVIGSKINNGELMNLGKGTGVVNADSSKTLAGMLNQVGQFGASGFGSGNGTLNNNINNDSLVINGVTVQGANIKDPETFVNGLLNLKAEALQRAYRHR